MEVLVAGDHSNRTLLLEVLPEWGYKVITADNGLDAWNLLQGKMGKPMMMILDWQMPGMSGIELCEKLKQGKEKSKLYVMLLVEANIKVDVAVGLEHGADDFLSAPISTDELQSRLALGKRILEYQHSLEQLTNELVEKDQELNSFADKDNLTGIASRSFFTTRLSEEWRRSLRSDQKLSMIMLDIDFFKDYNATYGQAAGDECLKVIANTIASSICRAGDFVARYSGAEFVVVLPDTDSLGALVVAESIRVAVAIQNIEHIPGGINGHVTVSAGTVSLIPDMDTQPDTLINRVQQTLYMAKAAGRNAVRQVA